MVQVRKTVPFHEKVLVRLTDNSEPGMIQVPVRGVPMSERRLNGMTLSVPADQLLIGIVVREGESEVVRYFADEDIADARSTPASVQRALSLLGAWKDVDADDALEPLDRIRHESKPTPPIDL
jgi:hypothetical protein